MPMMLGHLGHQRRPAEKLRELVAAAATIAVATAAAVAAFAVTAMASAATIAVAAVEAAAVTHPLHAPT